MNIAKKIVSGCLAKSNPDIKNEILKHDIISFDIFDTLIKRDVQNRELFFSLFSEEASKIIGCDKSDFPHLRINAEKAALSSTLPNHEVSFYDIYSRFGIESTKTIKNLIKLEEDAEIGASSISLLGKELFDFSIANSKNVVLISDMYLSKETIGKILKKNEIVGYSNLFLSSEIGLTKRSGALFRYVYEILKPSDSLPLHIGNDLQSDFIQARHNNFYSCLFNQYKGVTEYIDQGNKYLKKGILYDYVSNHTKSEFSNFEKLGFEVLGPLLLGYSQWLNKSRDPDSTLVFLSREGALLKEAYQSLFPKEKNSCKYAYVSRRALIGVQLANVKSIFELVCIMRPLVSSNLRLGDLVRYSFVTEEKLLNNDELSFLDLDSLIDQAFENAHPAVCENLLLCIREENFDSARCFRIYWDEITCGSKKISISDVGWRGSMQDILQNLLPECTFEGYYFGVEPLNKCSNKHGFLYPECNSSIYNNILFSRQLFELLFLNPSGSVVGYSLDSRKIKPLFDVIEYDQIQVGHIIKMQKAAIIFVRCFKDSWVCSKNFTLGKTEIYGCYDSLIVDNFKKLFETFGAFKANDGGVWSLFPSHGWKYWLLHLNELFNEFSHSYCKSLYLKRLFKLPLPYSRILGLLKWITRSYGK